jgi:hypothetical protein
MTTFIAYLLCRDFFSPSHFAEEKIIAEVPAEVKPKRAV